MDGMIVIDKGPGMTSFDVVRSLRKLLAIKKIGHTGTLDPLATGVLILCLGKATRLAQEIEAESKVYEAEMDFGYRTDSYDIEGKLLEKSEKQEVNLEEFQRTLSKYLGKTMQTPPMYSALKVNGQKLYELARKGIEVERKLREIQVDFIHILDFQKTRAKIETKVSKGTYIRSLIDDIGKDLGNFATMTALRRSQVGNQHLKNSYTISKIRDMIASHDFSFCISVEEYFSFPKIHLKGEKEKILFENGNTVKQEEKNPDGKYRVYFEGTFLGLATLEREVLLKGYKYF